MKETNEALEKLCKYVHSRPGEDNITEAIECIFFVKEQNTESSIALARIFLSSKGIDFDNY